MVRGAMPPPDEFATLVNLTGFAAGLALYAMLLVMVLRNPDAAMASPGERADGTGSYCARRPEPLLVGTAALGLVWNLGALWIYGLGDLGFARPPAPVAAIAFIALGFLPAVVVHAALQSALVGHRRGATALAVSGYAVSALAGLLQAAAAWGNGGGRSAIAFRVLVWGFAAIVAILAVGARRRVSARRALLLGALALFAVSALHLADHEALRDSWSVELVGHHASIPLALVILYQDYPFALADLFLKRALVVVCVLAGTLVAYAAMSAWLLPGPLDPLTATALGALGLSVALAYPFVRRGARWFVDRVVLGRADYAAVHAALADEVAAAETPEEALQAAARRLAPALAAREAGCWRLEDGTSVEVGPVGAPGREDAARMVARAHAIWSQTERGPTVWADAPTTSAVVIVPTAEPPRYALTLGALAGGRRLLSDDRAMLDEVARTLARRCDFLRLEGERLEQRVREAEIRQLVTEAELRALRAQVNPHFLFNALTTVGYLIQTSPGVALDKLLQLTELLRRVLRSEGEFTTLGHELELVRLYLDLERARFEERLRVEVDVPRDLTAVAVPAFVLQPLVENAVKHGIAPAAGGGTVTIRAALETPVAGETTTLCLTVRNTGVAYRRGPRCAGIGLRNLERRLHHHYGHGASLQLEPAGPQGTLVTVRLPVATAATRGGRVRDEQVPS